MKIRLEMVFHHRSSFCFSYQPLVFGYCPIAISSLLMALLIHARLFLDRSISSLLKNVITKLFLSGFALLPNKYKKTYSLLFKKIKELVDFQPGCPINFFVDYERAVISSIEKFFPNIRITGCLFLFKQCIRRKLSELKLIHLYNTGCLSQLELLLKLQNAQGI